MKTFFTWMLIFIIAMIICVIGGNYAGASLYHYLAGKSISSIGWYSLYDGVTLNYKHPDFTSAVWGSILAVWIVFLPVLSAVIAMWLNLLPKKQKLYGNARFANNREMEAFHYVGDYKKL